MLHKHFFFSFVYKCVAIYRKDCFFCYYDYVRRSNKVKNEYLNEENFQKKKAKIKRYLLISLVVGLTLGGLLIYNGVKKPSPKKLEEVTAQLKDKKAELIAKGLTPNSYYDAGEAYDLYIIDRH